MKTTRCLRRALLILTLLSSSAIVACAPDDGDAESAEEAATKARSSRLDATVASFEGKLSIDVSGTVIPYAFSISKIDWKKQTAVGSSRMDLPGAEGGAINLKVKWSTARCDCVVFKVSDNVGEVAEYQFEKGKLLRASFAGVEAIKPRVTKVTGTDKSVWNTKTKIDNTVVLVEGAFAVKDTGYNFSLSDIDWKKGAAKWSEQKIDTKGSPIVLPAKISAARCPGCYGVDITEKNGTVVHLSIGSGVIDTVTYGKVKADEIVTTYMATTEELVP